MSVKLAVLQTLVELALAGCSESQIEGQDGNLDYPFNLLWNDLKGGNAGESCIEEGACKALQSGRAL